MQMKWSLLLVSIAPLLLGACSTYGYKTSIGDKTYAAVDYRKVKLLFAAPDKPYEVIGVVSVQGGTLASAGDMYQKLIKSAAALGADAVIVTGEGSNQAIVPGVATTSATGNAQGIATSSVYGNTVDTTAASTYSGTSSTYATPTYIANMPTNKGFAIKFTK